MLLSKVTNYSQIQNSQSSGWDRSHVLNEHLWSLLFPPHRLLMTVALGNLSRLNATIRWRKCLIDKVAFRVRIACPSVSVNNMIHSYRTHFTEIIWWLLFSKFLIKVTIQCTLYLLKERCTLAKISAVCSTVIINYSDCNLPKSISSLSGQYFHCSRIVQKLVVKSRICFWDSNTATSSTSSSYRIRSSHLSI